MAQFNGKPTTVSVSDLLKQLIAYAPNGTGVANALWKNCIKKTADIKKATDSVTIRAQRVVPKKGTWVDVFKCFTLEKNKIEKQLEKFAEEAITHILFPVRNRPGQTKALPPSSILTGKGQTGQKPTGTKEKAARDSEAFRKELGDRDDWICVITGVNSQTKKRPGVVEGPLEGAHILPHHLADKDKVGFRLALALFAGPKAKIAESLKSKINDASNGMLIEPNCHASFDKLHWSIQATQVPPNQNNWTYKVCCTRNGPNTKPAAGLATSHLTNDPILTFGAGNNPPNNDNLPDPYYCNLHYAVSKVVNLTGLADVFDTFLDEDDAENPPVASDDFPHTLLGNESDVEEEETMSNEETISEPEQVSVGQNTGMTIENLPGHNQPSVKQPREIDPDQETDISDIEAEGTRLKQHKEEFSNPFRV
ncbi:hypothetical protein M408DRAFT_329781 [Serendipita vermifera MAFF 305830]|uniref:HNH nuclease domain-containing protein n=1 Tax=Serendipita vermifera MAFF 305830 TaxID=933852 RepID=A0A0C2WNN2_SERVB|nr:hypothetical protein M408DRAFT_329781 [Serendipita vermifera MAFF 305830]